MDTQTVESSPSIPYVVRAFASSSGDSTQCPSRIPPITSRRSAKTAQDLPTATLLARQPEHAEYDHQLGGARTANRGTSVELALELLTDA